MADTEARKQYALAFNKTLGLIMSATEQTVAGKRYKIVYGSEVGNVLASVIVVSWLNNSKV